MKASLAAVVCAAAVCAGKKVGHSSKKAVEVGKLAGVEGRQGREDGLCDLAPEIVILQDSSTSLREVGKELTANLKKVMAEWRDHFPGEVRLGLSQFSDKAIAMRGVGYQYFFNRYPEVTTDLCYEFNLGLSTEDDDIQAAFESIIWRNGGDLPECQYEALLYSILNPEVNWTPASILYDSEGRKITRIVVIITDDRSHLDGDGFKGIQEWNGPFDWLPGTNGGWGSSQFHAKAGNPLVFDTDPNSIERQEYYKLSEQLFYKYLVNGIYDEELVEKYTAKYGPEKYDPMVIRNPGTLEAMNNNTLYDYVSLEQLRVAVQDHNIVPIVLVTNSTAGPDRVVDKLCIKEWGYEGDSEGKLADRDDVIPCLIRFYESELHAAGITNVIVDGFRNAEEVTETLMSAVLRVADYTCFPETTTTIPPVEPPVKGPNIPLIAGATAGAVVGAALLGAGLWKYFLLAAATDDPIEQVEAPEQDLVRETAEDVDMEWYQ